MRATWPEIFWQIIIEYVSDQVHPEQIVERRFGAIHVHLPIPRQQHITRGGVIGVVELKVFEIGNHFQCGKAEIVGLPAAHIVDVDASRYPLR